MMSDPASEARSRLDGPLLQVSIVPHRALTAGQYLALSSLSLVLMIVVQFSLLRLGAWPAALFSGVEGSALLLVILLHRRAQEREEVIEIADGNLRVSRRRRGRIIDDQCLPVFGMKVIRIDDPEYGCQTLAVRSRGYSLEIARDLSPDERMAFSDTFAIALRKAGGDPHVVIVTRRSLTEHLIPGEAA